MVRYRIGYINKHPKRSDRARMAIDLKEIYWRDRERPKDWYWFEGNISIKSIEGGGKDRVEVEFQQLDDCFDNVFFDELRKNKDIDFVAYDQSDNFYITIYSKFP